MDLFEEVMNLVAIVNLIKQRSMLLDPRTPVFYRLRLCNCCFSFSVDIGARQCCLSAVPLVEKMGVCLPLRVSVDKQLLLAILSIN